MTRLTFKNFLAEWGFKPYTPKHQYVDRQWYRRDILNTTTKPPSNKIQAVAFGDHARSYGVTVINGNRTHVTNDYLNAYTLLKGIV